MATRGSDRPRKARKVNVSVSMGDLNPSPEQVKRLKAFVESQVLTWVRADLGDKRSTVICNEDMFPCKEG